MLPVDIGVGGGIMLVLILPNILFYFGLCRKRWKQVGGPQGDVCPFLGGPAHNRCRVCGTFVSDRAFHRTCSLTTQQTQGNIVTTTTSTAYGWDHCVGCHTLKCKALLIFFLLAMIGLWGYTVVERVLAVLGLTHRDERVRSFNVTMYALTVVTGLISWATVWCTRKTLLRFSCVTPFGCCTTTNGAACKMQMTTSSAAVAPVVPAVPATATPASACNAVQVGVAVDVATPSPTGVPMVGVTMCGAV